MRDAFLRLAACLLAGAFSTAAVAQTSYSSLVQRQLNLEGFDGYQRGDCKTPTGVAVDMNRVLFLSNDWVEVGSAIDPSRLRITGRTLVVQHMSRRLDDGRPYEIAIPLRGALNNDIDGNVDFSLAHADGMLLVYWREPYRFRRVRQGLMRIEVDDVTPWCEGEGGIKVNH